jgi:hypothetical protein
MRHRGSVSTWAIIGIAAAIAVVGLLTVQSLRTTASSQSHDASASAPAKTEVEPTKYEITPSPVIELNPRFFIGTGDGSSGSYEEPQRR